MLGELEAAVVDSLRSLIRPRHVFAPTPGAVCANCGETLHGRYCHGCGQDADTRRRSLAHLAWEALKSLFDLDGRMLRTLPALFFDPGMLARDYLENHVARHVPPLRTFLVALLVFVLCAENGTHEWARATARHTHLTDVASQTPAGRAKVAANIRREAVDERRDDFADATADRNEGLREGGANRAAVEAAYKAETARVEAHFASEMARTDRILAGQPDVAPAVSAPRAGSRGRFDIGIRRATANPDYYLAVLFTWSHRAAILLLPIVGLSLALVYRRRRRFFLYDHLVVAMDLLSFAFFANALGFILPQPIGLYWLGLVALWTPINLYQTLRGAYHSGVVGAAFKTLFIWATTVIAFGSLMIGLLVFSLTQL